MSTGADRGTRPVLLRRLVPRREPRPKPRFEVVLAAGTAEIARAVEDALASASIPYETGLQSRPEPRIVFSVPAGRLEEARDVVAQFFGTGPLAAPDAEEAPRAEIEASFPWKALWASAALVLLHLVVLAAAIGENPDARRLAAAGGLVTGAGAPEAWRLLSYSFVHASVSHVLWNGLSLFVFAVPLLDRLGGLRTALVYAAGALVGGAAALSTSARGTVTVGSSAAVAALFGAWVVLAIRDARHAPLSRRALLRACGVGLLALPPLLTPATSGGARVSVAAHAGGLVAGICAGLGIRRPGPPPQGRGACDGPLGRTASRPEVPLVTLTPGGTSRR